MTATKTTVVNVRDAIHDVYIGRKMGGRDGYFGNPYRIEDLGGGEVGRKEAIARFKHQFEIRIVLDAEYRRRVLDLRGKKLGCWCAPLACHGDVIAEWVDAQPEAK